MGGEECFDCGDQVGDVVENAAPDRFLGELAEPTLDEVEPGARGRDEVEVEARCLASQASTLSCLWVR